MLARRDLALVVIVFAASALLRYQAIEPAAIRHVCGAAPWEGWCALRSALMLPFRHQEIGWIGLAAACAGFAASVLAPPLPSATLLTSATLLARGDEGRHGGGHLLAQALCRIGLGLGAAGLILYSFDPAAIALLLAAFTLARLRADSQAAPLVAST